VGEDKVKKFYFLILLAYSGAVSARNFTLYKTGREIGVACSMDRAARIKLYRAIGLGYGDEPPKGVFLKNAIPGTKVLLDDDLMAEARAELAFHGYQSMWIPKNEWYVSLRRPDGATLQFWFLKVTGPCVLEWDELSTALVQ
jgi:hypothetical protein